MSSHSIDTEGINLLAAFLHSRNGNDEGEMSMQLLKLIEEMGEVAVAWIGAHGQNPRKGVTHSLDDVLNELADVAITAMVGIARLGGDTAAVVGGKVAVMQERYAELSEGGPDISYPNPGDLLGADPGWTGGLPVDEYIDQARRRDGGAGMAADRDLNAKVADLERQIEAQLTEIGDKGARLVQQRDQLRAYRDAMRDVRRILTDFGITNPPPRLAALLASEETHG